MGVAHAQSASAWLELRPVPGRNIVQITGHALALDTISGLDFSLSLHRRNAGNATTSRQSGHVDLAAGVTKTLSTTSINMEPGDELLIELKLLDHGKEVSSATVSSRTGASGQSL